MAVPDFQSWFLPLLKRVADGKDYGMSELYQVLADDIALSSDDRAQLLKSGAQLIYENRIGWARTYLKKAGLIEAPSRGIVRITERGKGILAKPPEKLNVKFLRQFPEFVEFHTYKPDATSPKKADAMNSELCAAGTYTKLDQKNVTAWLDLRNKAAHGQYDQYSLQQVELLSQSVRDFLTRNPA